MSNGEGGGEPVAPVEKPWTEGFDESALGLVRDRGWKNPGDAVQSYRNLEKLQGVPENQLVKLPGDPDDGEAWGPVYDKLGRPANGEAYDFGEYQAPEGAVDLSPEYRAEAHKAGLNQGQARGLFDWYNTRVAEAVAEQEEQRGLQSEKDMLDLRKGWGKEYDANIEAGRRFAARAKQAGFDEDFIGRMENGGVGTKDLLRFTTWIGRATGEHLGPPREGDVGGAFGTTPARARERIAELKADPAFMARYMGSDKEAVEKMRTLYEAANAGQG